LEALHHPSRRPVIAATADPHGAGQTRKLSITVPHPARVVAIWALQGVKQERNTLETRG
jgi:hypothetical protein